jgi:hypothetical protein
LAAIAWSAFSVFSKKSKLMQSNVYAHTVWYDKWGETEVRRIFKAWKLITINVPLFKKLRDIIFFLRDNNFLSHFKGHFEGAKTFLTPYIVLSAARDNLGVKKVAALLLLSVKRKPRENSSLGKNPSKYSTAYIVP